MHLVLEPRSSKRFDEPDRSRLHCHLALDPERNQQHRVLQERADLTPERLAPVVIADGRLALGWPRNPARSAVLVIHIIAAEDRLQHAFLVANYQLVLDRE